MKDTVEEALQKREVTEPDIREETDESYSENYDVGEIDERELDVDLDELLSVKETELVSKLRQDEALKQTMKKESLRLNNI